MPFQILIGSKVQVYRGIAKETSGGLKKKDIIKTNVNGVVRYKSKKQQSNGSSKNKKSQKARSNWTKAYKKAIKEFQNGKDSEYYSTNILMFKPDRDYKGYTKKQIKMGNKLYNRTREIYDKK